MGKESKYTILRTKTDIKELHDTDGILEFYLNKKYNSDSKRYRDLPKVTAILAKKIQDLDKANRSLTAKVDELDQLKRCFCRINEICNGRK